MKAAIILVALLFSVPAFGQPLSGVYGGTARDVDTTGGSAIEQLARFTFVNGQLTALTEIYLYTDLDTDPPCVFTAGSGPLPYMPFAQVQTTNAHLL